MSCNYRPGRVDREKIYQFEKDHYVKLFDSHCHIDDRSFENDLEEMILRAENQGVIRMMIAGINKKSSERAIRIAETFDGVFASVGVHPHDVKTCSNQTLEDLKQMAGHPKVHAWGEIGLDFNRMYSPKKDQEKWFVRQVETAGSLNLPMIFHERDSNSRFFELLNQHFNPRWKGVVHCFSGNREALEQYLEMGLYIGITGILTLKTRGVKLRELAAHIPQDRLLVETDAPYLTPAPQKNKTRRNEPAFVKSVLLKLADITGRNPDQLADTTFKNTCRLFNIAE